MPTACKRYLSDPRTIVAALILAICVPPGAEAQTFVGFGGAKYDTGTDPSIAATVGNPSGIIEVHNGGSGASPLWFRPGGISPVPSTMSWSGSQQFDNHGYNPSIAANPYYFIEVHNGGSSQGPMWYRTGTSSENTTTGSINFNWSDSKIYDNFGFNPSIAAVANNPSIAAVGNTVVEVHNGGDTAGPLWYRTGKVNSDGTFTWSAQSHEYDSFGFNPSVSVRICYTGNFLNNPTTGISVAETCGLDVLEVHNGGNSVGQLWFRYGHSDDGVTINWQLSYPYDVGWNPKVSWFTYPDPGTSNIVTALFEVHSAQAGGDGPLLYNTGSSNPAGASRQPNVPPLSFNPAVQYGYGNNPSVAVGIYGACPTVVEVHGVQATRSVQNQMLYLGGVYSCFPD
jgi:hypothetical protein